MYPYADPAISDLTHLVATIGIAIKYVAGNVLHRLRQLLVSLMYLEAEPIRAYTIAVRFGWKEEV